MIDFALVTAVEAAIIVAVWWATEPTFYRAGYRCWNCGDPEDRRQLWRFVRRSILGWIIVVAGLSGGVAALALAIGFLRG